MITQDELEMFIDGLITPVYVFESNCSDDVCPIDFGGKGNDN